MAYEQLKTKWTDRVILVPDFREKINSKMSDFHITSDDNTELTSVSADVMATLPATLIRNTANKNQRDSRDEKWKAYEDFMLHDHGFLVRGVFGNKWVSNTDIGWLGFKPHKDFRTMKRKPSSLLTLKLAG